MLSQQTYSVKNKYHNKRIQESMDIVANVFNEQRMFTANLFTSAFSIKMDIAANVFNEQRILQQMYSVII